MLNLARLSHRVHLNIARPRRRRLPVALITLLLGTGIIGTVPIFVRLSELGPFATGFWRVALALPVLLLWSGLARRERSAPRHRPAGRSKYFWLVATGVCFAGDLALFNQALTATSVTNATLLINMSPIFVVLGARLIFGERVSRNFALGLAIALTGATVLVGSTFRMGLDSLSGDVLALLSAVATAGYTLSIKRVRDSFSAPASLAWSGLVCGLVLLALVTLSGERLFAAALYGWLPLLGLALISHVGGQGLITKSLAHLPASSVSICYLMQPVVAALLAWVILREPLGFWQAAGGAIVLAGICLAQRVGR